MRLRLSALTLFILFTIPSFSQAKFGAFIGANNPYWIFKNDYYDSKTQLKLCFQGGMQSDIKFNTHVGMQIGLYYNSKGSKYDYSETVGIFNGVPMVRETKNNFTLHYITLPVEIKIGTSLNEKTEIYGNAGMYIGYMVSGKSNIEVAVDGVKDHENNESLDIGGSSYQINPLDYGAKLGAGVNFNSGLFIRTWYSLGLVNLNYYRNNIINARNAEFALSVGLFFTQ